MPIVNPIHEISDSAISQLRTIKQIDVTSHDTVMYKRQKIV